MDHRLPLLNGDGLGRADVGAHATAHTVLFHHLGLLAEHLGHHRASQPLGQVLPVPLKEVAVARLNALEVWDHKVLYVALDGQLFRRGGNEPSLQRRLQGGHLLPAQAQQLGAHQVRLVRALRGRQKAHMARGTSGRPVALHARHGVYNGQAWLEILVQVHDHPGEVPRVRKPEVILRLHGAWDGTEHVLGSTGHSHHAVGLQLAEIDDGVRL